MLAIYRFLLNGLIAKDIYIYIYIILYLCIHISADCLRMIYPCGSATLCLYVDSPDQVVTTYVDEQGKRLYLDPDAQVHIASYKAYLLLYVYACVLQLSDVVNRSWFCLIFDGIKILIIRIILLSRSGFPVPKIG